MWSEWFWLNNKRGGSTQQHYEIHDVKSLNIRLGGPNFNYSTFTIFISTFFFKIYLSLLKPAKTAVNQLKFNIFKVLG